jgi:hypothetical protein
MDIFRRIIFCLLQSWGSSNGFVQAWLAGDHAQPVLALLRQHFEERGTVTWENALHKADPAAVRFHAAGFPKI